jgi:hypothetical protein
MKFAIVQYHTSREPNEFVKVGAARGVALLKFAIKEPSYRDENHPERIIRCADYEFQIDLRVARSILLIHNHGGSRRRN